MGSVTLKEIFVLITALAVGFGGMQSSQILFFAAGMIAGTWPLVSHHHPATNSAIVAIALLSIQRDL